MDTTAIFNGIYTANAEARASVRKGRQTIERAMISGYELHRQNSGQGQYRNVDASIRYLLAEEGSVIDTGDIAEFKMDSSDEWIKFRVAGRKLTGTVVELIAESMYEE